MKVNYGKYHYYAISQVKKKNIQRDKWISEDYTDIEL